METYKIRLTVILSLLLLFLKPNDAFERDLTIHIDQGKSDCFYQSATEGQTIDVEFQVIDGTGGMLDVGFTLSAPNGRILVSLSRRQSGIARADASVSGDYRFCFDNTHSTLSSKMVYFDILIDNEIGESDEDAEKTEEEKNGLDLSTDLINVANRVALHLMKAHRLQEVVAARSSRDEHAVTRSAGRVTFCSLVNAIAIFAIGILQVVLVRGLFDEKSRINSILNKFQLTFF